MWLMNNRNLFLTVLEAGIQDECASMGLVRALILEQTYGCVLNTVKGAKELTGASFIRALIPFMRAPSL